MLSLFSYTEVTNLIAITFKQFVIFAKREICCQQKLLPQIDNVFKIEKRYRKIKDDFQGECHEIRDHHFVYT